MILLIDSSTWLSFINKRQCFSLILIIKRTGWYCMTFKSTSKKVGCTWSATTGRVDLRITLFDDLFCSDQQFGRFGKFDDSLWFYDAGFSASSWHRLSNGFMYSSFFLPFWLLQLCPGQPPRTPLLLPICTRLFMDLNSVWSVCFGVSSSVLIRLIVSVGFSSKLNILDFFRQFGNVFDGVVWCQDSLLEAMQIVKIEWSEKVNSEKG